MQNEAQTKVISGVTYGVYMLPPRIANRMLIRIVKIVGPSLGVLLEEVDEEEGLKGLMNSTKVDGAFIGKVARELCARLDEKTLEGIMDTFAEVSEVDGASMPKVFDAHFRGKVGEMYVWFIFALEVNYSSFGNAWDIDLSQRTQATQSASK